jgi:hypothetical protein
LCFRDINFLAWLSLFLGTGFIYVKSFFFFLFFFTFVLLGAQYIFSAFKGVNRLSRLSLVHHRF